MIAFLLMSAESDPVILQFLTYIYTSLAKT